MRARAKIKIVAGLLVVFVAGALLGAWVHSKVTEKIFLKLLDNRTWAPPVLESLTKELDLDSKQKHRTKILLDQTVDSITERFAQMGGDLVCLHVRFQSILTPEQQAKDAKAFGKFRQELQEKFCISLPSEASVTNFASFKSRD